MACLAFHRAPPAQGHKQSSAAKRRGFSLLVRGGEAKISCSVSNLAPPQKHVACVMVSVTGCPLKTDLALARASHLGKVTGGDAKGGQTEEKSVFDFTAQRGKRKGANYFLLVPKPGPDGCFDASSNTCPT